MQIPGNVIATADDFGLNHSVNQAILRCFEQGYVNSTSVLTNMPSFDEAVQLIHQNSVIRNIGVHVNLAEGKPLTNFPAEYLDGNGNWHLKKINRINHLLNSDTKLAFVKEIEAQINKALENKINITHFDSHFHLHTLPSFHELFLKLAKQYNLKLRLAQTFKENSYIKFFFRMYINSILKKSGHNYSDYFETVKQFLQYRGVNAGSKVSEIMLHPALDAKNDITDHFDKAAMVDWLSFIKEFNEGGRISVK